MMAFGKTYEAIKEMIIDTALYTPTARDIVRRAGLRPGGVPGERRMGMLLIAEGSEQTPAGGDTPVAYSTLVANDDGYIFTPGESSWIVPTSGLYRLTATLCLGTPSTPEGLFGHAFVAETSGARAVLQIKHYVEPTTSPLPERIVLNGTGTVYLEAGEAASHVFFSQAGTPGNILQDPEASRLYVEKVL